MSTEHDDRLREILRREDPAGSEAPMTHVERSALRNRLLGAAAEALETTPGRFGWLPMAAAAALVVVAAGSLWWAVRPTPPPAANGGTGAVATTAVLAPRHPAIASRTDVLQPRTSLQPSVSNDLHARRTIHFTAPRGTRLVWVVADDPGDAG